MRRCKTATVCDDHQRRQFLTVVASAVGGAALTACGGDGAAAPLVPSVDTGSPSPPAPPDADPKSALAAIIAAARENNAVVNRPWTKAPTYSPNTAYFRGGCVRGLGADAASVYQCVKLQGTSGVSSPPTGTGSDGMPDGSTAWLYWGRGTADSDVPLFSTVTPTGPGAVMDGFMAYPQTPAGALGLTRTYPMSFSNPPARVSGGSALLDNGGYIDVLGPLTGNISDGSRATSARRHKLHFMTDCRKWLAIAQNGPLYATSVSIEVNGRWLTEGDVTNAALINPGYLLLNMSRFGAGPHEVVIRKFDQVASSAHSLSVGPDESIWPANGNGLSVAFEGDSISQGGGIGSQSISYLLDTLVGSQLGAERTYNNAIGGTGLISNLQGSKTTYLERLPDIVAFQPTIFIHGGYHNDGNLAFFGVTRAQRVSTILNYLRAFRAGCPHTTMFQFPAQTLGGEATAPGSSLHTLEQDVIEAFTQWGDTNAVLVPLLTASQPFPQTTADGWFFQTSGTIAEFRDGHPVQRYYPEFAAHVVAAVRAFFGVQS